MNAIQVAIVLFGLLALGAAQGPPKPTEEQIAAWKKMCAEKTTDADQKRFECMAKEVKVRNTSHHTFLFNLI